MKFRITLKDPDGFSNAIQEAVEASVSEIPGLAQDEREAVVEKRHEAVHDALKQWVEYSEYVTIEFDTDANTATVIKR